METKDAGKFLKELERAELEAPGGVASAQTYAQLLVTYIDKRDLCNAKYLWKRIPLNVKVANPELGRIWEAGVQMWYGQWSPMHHVLQAEWGEDISDLIKSMRENIREQAMTLIAKGYSSISLTVFASMVGLPLENARQAALDRGWSMDGLMVQPVKVNKEQTDFANAICLTEDELKELTRFVSFLEN